MTKRLTTRTVGLYDGVSIISPFVAEAIRLRPSVHKGRHRRAYFPDNSRLIYIFVYFSPCPLMTIERNVYAHFVGSRTGFEANRLRDTIRLKADDISAPSATNDGIIIDRRISAIPVRDTLVEIRTNTKPTF